MCETVKKNPQDKLAVRASRHAIEQFVSRSGSQQKIEKIGPKLERMVENGREVFKQDATMSLLNNGCKEARYFYRNSWVLVVVDGVITTCYQPKLREFKLG